MINFPLKTSQLKLYKFQKLYPDNPSYNLTYLYKITGNLKIERLKKITEICINNCDVSKVQITDDNEVYQSFDKSRTYTCEIINFDSIDYHEKIMKIANKYVNTPISITKWPLFRINIFTTPQKNISYFFISVHHIIGKRQSFGTFYQFKKYIKISR